MYPQSSMRKSTIAIICVLVLLGAGGVVYRLWTKSVTPPFPAKPRGAFVAQPAIVDRGGNKVVEWILPEKCEYNGYQIQQKGYYTLAPEAAFWSGLDSVGCIQEGMVYVCRAGLLPEINEKVGQGNLQASAHGCPSGEYFQSQVIGF